MRGDRDRVGCLADQWKDALQGSAAAGLGGVLAPSRSAGTSPSTWQPRPASVRCVSVNDMKPWAQRAVRKYPAMEYDKVIVTGAGFFQTALALPQPYRTVLAGLGGNQRKAKRNKLEVDDLARFRIQVRPAGLAWHRGVTTQN